MLSQQDFYIPWIFLLSSPSILSEIAAALLRKGRNCLILRCLFALSQFKIVFMRYVPVIIHEIELEYTRSRGPGGQHVNKTNSACLARWNVDGSKVINDEERIRLRNKLGNTITSDGDLFVRSDEFRDQQQNRKKCLEKLEALIERAFFEPKKRKATKPTKSSQRKRTDTKRQRGEIKSKRGKVKSWDD
jgi:ribosome-associated protein